MGITGGDLLAESGTQLANRLDLGVGECRLAVCVPEDGSIATPAELDGCRVATSFPNVTGRFLREHKAKSKVVILLTDGVSNAGEIDPMQAAKLAADNGIKVYTIAAGTPKPIDA